MYQAKATGATGYRFSYDGGITWKDFILDSSKYLTQGDSLYGIRRTINRAYGYWASSPSTNDSYYMMAVYFDGDVTCDDSNAPAYGFRPVVCLKSGISLKEVEPGKTYQI